MLGAAEQFKPASKLPLIVTGIAAYVGGALIAALVTAASMGGAESAGRKKGEDEAPKTTASAEPAGSAAGDAGVAPKEPTLAERAASGDAKAAAEIEKKPMEQRTLAEAVALARSRGEAKKKEMAELTRKIKLVPKLVKEDKEVAARFKELTGDEEVAIDVLHEIAQLPGPVGPDLLYGIISGSYRETRITKLAEELLYSQEVRKKASFALGALMDLRRAESCEDAMKAIEKVKQNGDRRAFNPLMRFHQKRGCGEKKLDDCWPCLRDGDLLKEATMEAQKRSPP